MSCVELITIGEQMLKWQVRKCRLQVMAGSGTDGEMKLEHLSEQDEIHYH